MIVVRWILLLPACWLSTALVSRICPIIFRSFIRSEFLAEPGESWVEIFAYAMTGVAMAMAVVYVSHFVAPPPHKYIGVRIACVVFSLMSMMSTVLAYNATHREASLLIGACCSMLMLYFAFNSRKIV